MVNVQPFGLVLLRQRQAAFKNQCLCSRLIFFISNDACIVDQGGNGRVSGGSVEGGPLFINASSCIGARGGYKRSNHAPPPSRCIAPGIGELPPSMDPGSSLWSVF